MTEADDDSDMGVAIGVAIKGNIEPHVAPLCKNVWPNRIADLSRLVRRRRSTRVVLHIFYHSSLHGRSSLSYIPELNADTRGEHFLHTPPFFLDI